MKRITILAFLLFQLVIASKAADTLVFQKPYLHSPDTVLVFEPQDVSGECPLLILLHGYGGFYGTWNDMTDIQSMADKYAMCIVCPDGLQNSWYINSPKIKDSRMTDFIGIDLIDSVVSAYKIDTNNIFITGQSMGGYGALWIASNFPEKFRAVSGMSVVPDLRLSRLSSDRIFELIGEEFVQNKYKLHDTIQAIDSMPLLLDCGNDDPFYMENIKFYDLALMKELNVSLMLRPGVHSRTYWSESLEYHLIFFRKQIKETATVN